MKTKGTVLIVDDDEVIQLIIEEFLTDYQFNILNAESPEKGLERIKNIKTIDIAIVDMNFPTMNGEEFILRANAINSQLKYIIHTAEPGYHIPDALKSIGITEKMIITKPIEDMMLFLHLINNLLGPQKNNEL